MPHRAQALVRDRQRSHAKAAMRAPWCRSHVTQLLALSQVLLAFGLATYAGVLYENATVTEVSTGVCYDGPMGTDLRTL